MSTPQFYILIGIIAIAIVAAILVLTGKIAPKPFSKLSTFAFIFVLTGIFFGSDNRLIGYGLIGIGVILAVIDMFMKVKKTENN